MATPLWPHSQVRTHTQSHEPPLVPEPSHPHLVQLELASQALSLSPQQTTPAHSHTAQPQRYRCPTHPPTHPPTNPPRSPCRRKHQPFPVLLRHLPPSSSPLTVPAWHSVNVFGSMRSVSANALLKYTLAKPLTLVTTYRARTSHTTQPMMLTVPPSLPGNFKENVGPTQVFGGGTPCAANKNEPRESVATFVCGTLLRSAGRHTVVPHTSPGRQDQQADEGGGGLGVPLPASCGITISVWAPCLPQSGRGRDRNRGWPWSSQGALVIGTPRGEADKAATHHRTTHTATCPLSRAAT